MEWPNINVNGSLQRFNEWFDSFILEAIKPLSILSMGLGTVAVFNLQCLAIDPRFVLSWAIVQALSMDGLFFATWDRLFSIKPSREKWLPIVGLSLIGIALAIVAIAINAILGFQVLWDIADSQGAMSRLGISSELFTIVRAILAVTVFVMVSFVRSHARATTEPTVAIVAKGKRSQKKAIVIEEHSPQKAISEHSIAIERIGDSPDGDDLKETSRSLAYRRNKHIPLEIKDQVYMRDGGVCVSCGYKGEYIEYDHIIPASKGGGVDIDNIQLLCRKCNQRKCDKLHDADPTNNSLQRNRKDIIKEVWISHMEQEKIISYKDIAKDAGVGYSTVKKWASEIKREIEQTTEGNS